MKMIRQGDVLLVPIQSSSVPQNLRQVAPENGRLILARGEATGHHHSVVASPSTSILAGPNDEMYLLVMEGDALLEHQEHAALPVRGTYRVVIQREWDEAMDARWRRVLD